MKVLLYEPGVEGHRPVILSYLVRHLPKFNFEYVVVVDPQFAKLNSRALSDLTKIARENGCDLIHLLTCDGSARRWLTPGLSISELRVPIVASYYLYSNLWGLRGIPWLLFRTWGLFDRLLISDPFLRERSLVPGLAGSVSYVPDAWDPEDFRTISRQDARTRLGLPADLKIFLVFGALSARKGVARILSAFSAINVSGAVLLLAGKVHDDIRMDLDRWLVGLGGRLVVHDRLIPEEEVAVYFSACDAVLSDYPRSFCVSSGVFTRCLAAGKWPIFPAHGVNYLIMKKLAIGCFYESESVEALATAMRRVALAGELFSISGKVASEVRSRESLFYVNKVVDAYRIAIDARRVV